MRDDLCRKPLHDQRIGVEGQIDLDLERIDRRNDRDRCGRVHILAGRKINAGDDPIERAPDFTALEDRQRSLIFKPGDLTLETRFLDTKLCDVDLCLRVLNSLIGNDIAVTQLELSAKSNIGRFQFLDAATDNDVAVRTRARNLRSRTLDRRFE